MDKDDIEKDISNSVTQTEISAGVSESNDKTGEELKLLKSKYESGEITVEEFNLAVNKLLDNL